MDDLTNVTVDQQLAAHLYDRYKAGESKSQLEISEWGDATSHGARVTRFWIQELGIDTRSPSKLATERNALETQLCENGIVPNIRRAILDHEYLVLRARQSAIKAVKDYNDPTSQLRTESFIVGMTIAWSSLFQAIMEVQGRDPYYSGSEGNRLLEGGIERTKSVSDLAKDVLDLGTEDGQAIKANLDFIIGLRDKIEHRFIPDVDAYVIHECQAMLLDFEEILISHFGENSALQGQLFVPLQISTLRPGASISSLKELQKNIPQEVIDYIENFAIKTPKEIRQNPHYRLKIFLTPVTANHEKSADSVLSFYRSGELPPELEESLRKVGVIDKPVHVSVEGLDLKRAGEITKAVEQAIPYKFHIGHHTRAWKHFDVRPINGASDPAATKSDMCVWSAVAGGYGYTNKWTKLLIEKMSDADVFLEITGLQPVLKS